MKKISITSLILIIFYCTSFCQIDSTITFVIKKPKNQKIRKNVISSELSFTSSVLIGSGLNYERIIKDNNTFIFNIGNYYSFNPLIEFYYYYCKVGYRYYFTKTRLFKKNQNNETFYLYKRQKQLLLPKGFYVGGITETERQYFKTYSTLYSEDQWSRTLFSIKVGGNVGYQFIFFDRFAINLSQTIYMGSYRIYNYAGQDNSNIFYLDASIYVNLNLGFAF